MSIEFQRLPNLSGQFEDPEAKLHPHLIMPGRKRIKVILATSLAYCPNLFMAKTPKKRMKKVIKLSICTYCLDADRNCLCRVQSKMNDHICQKCTTNYLLGNGITCLEKIESRRMRWSQTFSEAENRLLEKCGKENRLNPYQSETIEQRKSKGLADIDSSSEDSSGSDESNGLEEPDYGEVTTNPDRVPENQPNQGANTLLGKKFIS